MEPGSPRRTGSHQPKGFGPASSTETELSASGTDSDSDSSVTGVTRRTPRPAQPHPDRKFLHQRDTQLASPSPYASLSSNSLLYAKGNQQRVSLFNRGRETVLQSGVPGTDVLRHRNSYEVVLTYNKGHIAGEVTAGYNQTNYGQQVHSSTLALDKPIKVECAGVKVQELIRRFNPQEHQLFVRPPAFPDSNSQVDSGDESYSNTEQQARLLRDQTQQSLEQASQLLSHGQQTREQLRSTGTQTSGLQQHAARLNNGAGRLGHQTLQLATNAATVCSQSSHSHDREQRLEQLQTSHQQLAQEYHQQQQQLQELHLEHSQQSEQLALARCEYDQIEQQHRILVQQEKEQRQQIRELTDTITRQERELLRKTEELQQQESTRSELEQQQAELRQCNHNFQQEITDQKQQIVQLHKELDEQKRALHLTNNLLESTREKHQQIEAKLARSEQTLQQAQLENQELTSKTRVQETAIKDLEQQLSAQQDKHQQLLQQLESNLSTLELLNQEQEYNLQAAKSETDQANTALQQQTVLLQQIQQSADTHLHNLEQTQLRYQESDQRCREIQAQVEKLEARHGDLRRTITEHLPGSPAHEELEQSVAELIELQVKTSQQLTQEQEEHTQCSNKLYRLKHDYQEQHNQLTEANLCIRRQQRQLKKQQRELVEFEQLKKDTLSQIKDNEATFNAQQALLKELAQAYEQQEKASAPEASQQSQEPAYQQLQHEVQALSEQNARQNRTIERMTREREQAGNKAEKTIKQLDNNCKYLHSMLLKEQKQSRKLEAMVGERHQKIVGVQWAQMRAQTDLQTVQDRLQANRQATEELSEQLEQKEAELQQRSQELKQSNQQLEQFQQQNRQLSEEMQVLINRAAKTEQLEATIRELNSEKEKLNNSCEEASLNARQQADLLQASNTKAEANAEQIAALTSLLEQQKQQTTDLEATLTAERDQLLTKQQLMKNALEQQASQAQLMQQQLSSESSAVASLTRKMMQQSEQLEQQQQQSQQQQEQQGEQLELLNSQLQQTQQTIREMEQAAQEKALELQHTTSRLAKKKRQLKTVLQDNKDIRDKAQESINNAKKKQLTATQQLQTLSNLKDSLVQENESLEQQLAIHRKTLEQKNQESEENTRTLDAAQAEVSKYKGQVNQLQLQRDTLLKQWTGLEQELLTLLPAVGQETMSDILNSANSADQADIIDGHEVIKRLDSMVTTVKQLQNRELLVHKKESLLQQRINELEQQLQDEIEVQVQLSTQVQDDSAHRKELHDTLTQTRQELAQFHQQRIETTRELTNVRMQLESSRRMEDDLKQENNTLHEQLDNLQKKVSRIDKTTQTDPTRTQEQSALIATLQQQIAQHKRQLFEVQQEKDQALADRGLEAENAISSEVKKTIELREELSRRQELLQKLADLLKFTSSNLQAVSQQVKEQGHTSAHQALAGLFQSLKEDIDEGLPRSEAFTGVSSPDGLNTLLKALEQIGITGSAIDSEQLQTHASIILRRLMDLTPSTTPSSTSANSPAATPPATPSRSRSNSTSSGDTSEDSGITTRPQEQHFEYTPERPLLSSPSAAMVAHALQHTD